MYITLNAIVDEFTHEAQFVEFYAHWTEKYFTNKYNTIQYN